MTVSITTSQIGYDCDGVASSFTYPFKILQDSDLTVILTNSSDIASTLILDVDYTVTGAGNASGGTVVPATPSDWATGMTLTIERNTALTQDTDFTDGEAFSAESVENGLDKAFLKIQEQDRRLTTLEADATPVSTPRYYLIASDYVDLSDAIAQIGASTAKLVVDGNQTVSADLTIPVNVQLEIPKGPIITIDSGKALTINSAFTAGNYQVFAGSGTVKFGAGAVESVRSVWTGAIGDRTTDDSAAIQKVINICLANTRPIPLLVVGQHRLASSVMIDRSIPSLSKLGEFRIIGEGNGAGFYATTAMTMFSATANHTVNAVSGMTTFENVHFEVDNAATAAYVYDNAFIQMGFERCIFNKIKAFNSTGVNTFSHWFHKCKMFDWSGSFFYLSYTSSNDVSFTGNYANGGGDFYYSDVLQQGLRFIDNTLETMTGMAVKINGGRGIAISGNYVESIATGSSYMMDLSAPGSNSATGAFVGGNMFLMTDDQVADSNFYAMNWGAAVGGMSAGNYSNGKLNKLPTFPNFGAVHSFGDVSNGVKVYSPLTGESLKLYSTATSADISPYNVQTVAVTKAYSSDLFNAAGLTDNAVIWQQPAYSLLLNVTAVLDTQFAATGLTDLDVTVGDGGDNDGVLVQTMNLKTDAVATQYKARGAYWNGGAVGTEIYKTTATDWYGYATAVGANLSTLSAGSITFYFTYRLL